MRNHRRSRTLPALLALASLLALAPALPARAGPAEGPSRTGGHPGAPGLGSEFVARINRLRADHDLPPVTVEPRLAEVAGQWSEHMAGEATLSHNPDLERQAPPDWQTLGENVGEGPDVDSIFEAFVASPPHYANLTEARFTRVGVGVARSGDRLFTTHDFMEPGSGPR